MQRLKRAFYMLGVLMVIGVLVQFRSAAGAIDHVLALAFYAVLLAGSAFLLIRAWHTRHDPGRVHRPFSQIDLFPPRWRRWVLDEDAPPK